MIHLCNNVVRVMEMNSDGVPNVTEISLNSNGQPQVQKIGFFYVQKHTLRMTKNTIDTEFCMMSNFVFVVDPQNPNQKAHLSGDCHLVTHSCKKLPVYKAIEQERQVCMMCTKLKMHNNTNIKLINVANDLIQQEKIRKFDLIQKELDQIRDQLEQYHEQRMKTLKEFGQSLNAATDKLTTFKTESEVPTDNTIDAQKVNVI